MSTRTLTDVITNISVEPSSGFNANNPQISRAAVGLSAFRGVLVCMNGIGLLIDGGHLDTFDLSVQESDPPIPGENKNLFDGVDDGSIKLKDGAASNTQLAVPFTSSVSKTIHTITLPLSKLGVPALAAGGLPNVSVSFVEDNVGVPSGAAVGFASVRVNVDDIPTARTNITFTMDSAIDVVAGTNYWFILDGDYDADPNNCVQWHFDTVPGTSGFKFRDVLWIADTNKAPWYSMQVLEFTDVPDADLVPDGAFVQVVNQEVLTSFGLATHQCTRVLDMDKRKDTLRFKTVPVGTTVWFPVLEFLGFNARKLPVM